MTSLDDRLRAVPFFRALPPEDLAAIGGLLRPVTVRKGSVIFREGEAADALYLVDSGQLEVLRGRQAPPVASLGPGSVAGELALLLGEPRSATLRAASPCRLWKLGRDDLDRLLAAHSSIALELSAELGRRLVTTTRRLTHGDVTRFTVAVGDSARALAEALVDDGLTVGVLALRKTSLPERVSAVPSDAWSPQSLADLVGRRYDDLDHVVIAVPRSRTPLAVAALDMAEWAVTSDELPEWMAARHAPERVLRLDRSFSSAAAAARRVAGRAVGLALSSGGSKTVAHVGVIAALRQSGIRIDAAAGASGGALVAMGVAAEISTAEITGYIRELAGQLRPRRWDVHLIPRTALMKGRRLRNLFDRWFEGREFADLSIPLYVIASDIVTGEEVVITSGSLADAMRATLSIPGAFDPWRHQGRLFIDGGVTNPLPTGTLRQQGYERVIASNVAGKDVDPSASAGARLPNLFTVMLRTMNLMEAEVIKAQLPLADVVIRPQVKAKGSFDFTQIDEFIAEGHVAAARQANELHRLGFSPG
jgi:NTE family protein